MSDEELLKKTPEVAQSLPQLHLRTIKSALRSYLAEDAESGVEWINVIGEDSVQPLPTKVWDQELEDSEIHVMVAHGWSEGYLLYAMAQRDRYAPGKLRPVFQIKVICSVARTFTEAQRVWSWFQSEAFWKLKQVHSLDYPEVDSPQEASSTQAASSDSALDLANMLTGYSRTNLEAVAKLAQRTDWRALARWEQNRRAASFLELVNDATLADIAAGEIDVQSLCRASAEACSAAAMARADAPAMTLRAMTKGRYR